MIKRKRRNTAARVYVAASTNVAVNTLAVSALLSLCLVCVCFKQASAQATHASATARRQSQTRAATARRASSSPNTPARADSRAQPAPTEPAQTPEGATQTAAASNVSPDEADLSITAHVTARELRFEEVPTPTVEFTGRPRRETVWEADRENLPRPVRPGETYRDIGVRLRILSVFADIDRIVAEALGEVPVNEDGDTSSPAPSSTPAQQPASPPVAPTPVVSRSAPPTKDTSSARATRQPQGTETKP